MSDEDFADVREALEFFRTNYVDPDLSDTALAALARVEVENDHQRQALQNIENITRAVLKEQAAIEDEFNYETQKKLVALVARLREENENLRVRLGIAVFLGEPEA